MMPWFRSPGIACRSAVTDSLAEDRQHRIDSVDGAGELAERTNLAMLDPDSPRLVCAPLNRRGSDRSNPRRARFTYKTAVISRLFDDVEVSSGLTLGQRLAKLGFHVVGQRGSQNGAAERAEGGNDLVRRDMALKNEDGGTAQ